MSQGHGVVHPVPAIVVPGVPWAAGVVHDRGCVVLHGLSVAGAWAASAADTVRSTDRTRVPEVATKAGPITNSVWRWPGHS